MLLFQCMMHLEDRLQEIYFKSKMMAEYLKKNKNVQDLLNIFGYVCVCEYCCYIMLVLPKCQ